MELERVGKIMIGLVVAVLLTAIAWVIVCMCVKCMVHVLLLKTLYLIAANVICFGLVLLEAMYAIRLIIHG